MLAALADREGYEGTLRVVIANEDLLQFGMAHGCTGCIAANRGGPHGKHTEECRRRIEIN